jgi:hypothetical protein
VRPYARVSQSSTAIYGPGADATARPVATLRREHTGEMGAQGLRSLYTSAEDFGTKMAVRRCRLQGVGLRVKGLGLRLMFVGRCVCFRMRGCVRAGVRACVHRRGKRKHTGAS